MNLYFLVKIKI